MNPHVALALFAIGVAGLFYLDREPGAKVTKALWLPTIWAFLAGTRAPSAWLGAAGPARMAGAQYQRAIMQGNPLDAAAFGFLLLLAIAVLVRRRREAAAALRWMWPTVIYFGYCFLSIAWSNIPGVAGKRWIKSLGDLAMALIVATEPDIAAALRRLASRLGIWILPASYMTIRYFPAIGRSLDPSGAQSNVGLSTSKNLLGAIAFLLTVAAFWQILSLAGQLGPGRRRRAAAQAAIMAFGAVILYSAHSATSVAATLFAGALLIAFSLPALRKPAAVHALVALILVAGLTAFALGAEKDVTHDLGRKSNLTGRTHIWAAVLAQAAEHPILGVGFESFWTGVNLDRVLVRLPPGMIANESHDGYIEVYAELGLVGLALMAWLLLTAYRRAAASFARDWRTGRLLVAWIAALAIYNISEAGFRMLDSPWVFMLLSFACAAGILARPPAAITGPADAALNPAEGVWAPALSVGSSRLGPGLRAVDSPSWNRRGAV
jgi:exopolysaccharide production protein ExoQ